MNQLIRMIAALVTANGAVASDVQIFKNVTITTCGTRMMGCAPTLSFSSLSSKGGKTYLVDQNYAEDFLKRHGHQSSEQNQRVDVREVMGIVTKEKGHFPNPTAEFEVIKIIKMIE
jgi:hypothetical protein